LAERKKVLLIDDETDIAALVALCLEPLGVELVHSADLQGAIDAAAEDEIGLILLDLALAEEDGLAILPRLRADSHLRDVPIVAFTAHDSRRREAFACGVDSFVKRPFTGTDLVSTVRLHLAG
jgi:DNA-binding response OmpR family regulator